MKVAVTGASGFVGRHFVERIAVEMVQVLALSRSKPEFLPGNVQWNASPELDENAHWGDLLEGVHTVVHLAGRAHFTQDTAENPLIEFRRVNTQGTLGLAKQGLEKGIKRFVFVSSIGVHGIETNSPLRPDSPSNPVDCYAISKYEAEELLQELFSDTDVELIIVRPPMVYGIDAPGNFQRLLNMVKKGFPLPFGLTCNRRSLVSVHNLSEILWRATTYSLPSCSVILPCDGEVLSTGQIVEGIAQALGRPSRLLPVPISLLYGTAALLGKRRVAVKMLGNFEIDPEPMRELLGWDKETCFADELRARF